MKKYLSWPIIFAVIAGASVIKLHLLGIPLERDEGEYAYIAQLLMGGTPLYFSAFSAKLPGIYFFYAVIMMLFGQNPTGIHFGLLLLSGATTVFVFLLGRRLLDTYAGVAAAVAFAILTLGKYTLAFNIEHLVIFLVLGGLLLMLRAIDRGAGFFMSGIVFGLAFIAKQHAAFFVLFGALYLVWIGKERAKRAGFFLAGSALPFAALCVLFYAQGVFGNFWFWVVTYASRYCTVMTLPDGIRSFFYIAGKIAGCAPLVWVAAGFGLLTVSRLERQRSVFLIGFLVASFLAVTPGLYFRHHYFIFLFPAAAFLVGAVAYSRTKALTVILILLFGVTVFQQRQFLFGMDPAAASRAIYVNAPVTESVEIADYIEEHSGKDARVIVLGSEPQIYFYLRRSAPINYIYMYPLTENSPYALPFQGSLVKEIEAARADYLIGVHIATSWFNWYVNKKLSEPLFAWIEAYQNRYYDVVGVADMVSRDKTTYHWDEDARRYKPVSDNYILILKRRAS